MQKHIVDDNIIWPDAVDGGRMTRPRFKTRFDPGDGKTNPVSTWINLKSQNGTEDDIEITCLGAGMNQEATKELRELFGEQVLDHPKPTSMIKGLLAVTTRNDDVVLDFFAGSGTTAHAVLDLNKQDGGNRKFILVQLPEPTGRTDYPTIADICKERVRRVIKKLSEEDSGKLDLECAKPQDRGFKVFKLAESNFKPWNAAAPKDTESLAQQLDLHVDHIRDGRTADDLLYELLLKSGFPLTTPVQKLRFDPQKLKLTVFSVQQEGQNTESLNTEHSPVVYSVADGAMLICLERNLTLDLIRAMADKKPERVVCLDEGFALPDRQAGGNDQLKANAVQIFKTKGVTSFRRYEGRYKGEERCRKFPVFLAWSSLCISGNTIRPIFTRGTMSLKRPC